MTSNEPIYLIPGLLWAVSQTYSPGSLSLQRVVFELRLYSCNGKNIWPDMFKYLGEFNNCLPRYLLKFLSMPGVRAHCFEPLEFVFLCGFGLVLIVGYLVVFRQELSAMVQQKFVLHRYRGSKTTSKAFELMIYSIS